MAIKLNLILGRKERCCMKKSVMLSILFIVFLVFGVCNYATAQIVFEDNFDSIPDWYTKKSFAIGQPCKEGEHATSCNIPNWTQWKNDEIWNPYDTVKPRSESRPGLEISGFAHYSSSGKALVITNEHHNGTDSSGWGSDTILAKDLGADYKELYTQFKIKYQPNFTWSWKTGFMAAAIKTFRWMHWDRTENTMPYSGGPGTNNSNAPLLFLDMTEDEYGGMLKSAFRCDPQQDTYVNYNGSSYKVYATHTASSGNIPPNTSYWQATTYNASFAAWQAGTVYRISNYYCNANRDAYANTSAAKAYKANGTRGNTLEETVADGNWHTLTMHVKLNSDTSTADGVYELWQDGFLIYSKYDLKYIDIGGDSNIGINGVMFGGNNFSNYPEYGQSPTVVAKEKLARDGNGALTTVREQWYAIDDVIISTTPIPKDYIISGSKLIAAPQKALGAWLPISK